MSPAADRDAVHHDRKTSMAPARICRKRLRGAEPTAGPVSRESSSPIRQNPGSSVTCSVARRNSWKIRAAVNGSSVAGQRGSAASQLRKPCSIASASSSSLLLKCQ